MADPPLSSRFGAYSDFWTRYLNWGVRHCPWSLEPILLALYAFLFFVAAKSFRRGIHTNLAALFPHTSSFKRSLMTYRVFWNFAAVAVDGARAREEPGIVEWEVEGLSHFKELRDSTSGIILLTAHMGNYDLAGSVFAERIGRTVHAVRAPERTPELQALRQAELKNQEDDFYHVVYNEPGNMLGITLTRALQNGDAVAIQGDRVLFDVSPLRAEWDADHVIDLPQGPFILSLTTGSPIYPLFLIRLGRCRYRVDIGPAFHCHRTGRHTQADLQRAAQLWTALLKEKVTRLWYQWLVVETNVKPKEK